MRRLAVAIGLVAVLVLAGCGGDSDDDAAPATTAPPTTAAQVAVGNDQAGTPFCQLARTYSEKYSTILAAASDPVRLRAVTTDAESAIRQAQATAPAEIRSDVRTVAKTAGEALSMLQKNNFDLAGSTDVLAKLTDPKFQASLANVNRYARAHCGVA